MTAICLVISFSIYICISILLLFDFYFFNVFFGTNQTHKKGLNEFLDRICPISLSENVYTTFFLMSCYKMF